MRALTALLLLIGTAATPASPQKPGSQTPGRQVLTSDMLRGAGVRRLGDVLPLIEDWDIASVDGFTWALSADGANLYGQPSWTLLVDGQVIDPDIFGVRSLDRIPLPLARLDPIVISSSPGIQHGIFNDGGVIHIHTRRPENGLSLNAHGVTANETGDPGPFKFTELATPNIDRIGSEVSGGAAFGARRAYVEASAGWREHFITDPLLRRRVTDISTDFPIIKQTAFSFSAGLTSVTGHHQLLAAHSETRDYFFLKQLGREVPAESPLTHVGVNGTERLDRKTSLRYRLGYSGSALQERANSLGIDFDWDVDRWAANLEALRQEGSYEASLGAAYRYVSASSGYELSDSDYDLLDLHAGIGYRLDEVTRQELTVSLTVGGNQVAIKTALANHWRPDPNHSLEASISYVERLPEEDDRIWYWQRRGYDFLADNGVEVNLEAEERKARDFAAQIRWDWHPTEEVDASIDLGLRSFSGLSLEEQRFEFDSASRSFSGPVSLLGGRGGEIWATGIGASWQPTPSLELRGHYRYQDALGGHDLFQAAWRTIPRNRLQLKALYEPWPSVSLWGMIDCRSSAEWSDYAAAATQTDGVYSSRLDDALTLDLAAQNWFWNRRLRLNLLLRNILDDAVPYHPIGLAYGLSFIVQAELLLDGFWKPR